MIEMQSSNSGNCRATFSALMFPDSLLYPWRTRNGLGLQHHSHSPSVRRTHRFTAGMTWAPALVYTPQSTYTSSSFESRLLITSRQEAGTRPKTTMHH